MDFIQLMPVFFSLFLKFSQRIHVYFFSGCQFTFRPIFFLSHMKGAGILVLSLWGVHLWEKAPLYLAGKKYKKLCIFFPYHLLYSCNQTSFRGQKWLGHPQISLLQGFHSKFSKSIPAPFIWEPPRGISASLLLNQASSGYAPRAFFFFLLSLPTAQRGL